MSEKSWLIVWQGKDYKEMFPTLAVASESKEEINFANGWVLLKGSPNKILVEAKGK